MLLSAKIGGPVHPDPPVLMPLLQEIEKKKMMEIIIIMIMILMTHKVSSRPHQGRNVRNNNFSNLMQFSILLNYIHTPLC